MLFEFIILNTLYDTLVSLTILLATIGRIIRNLKNLGDFRQKN
jgi:hypothetical protein